jgi:hypothetical protein
MTGFVREDIYNICKVQNYVVLYNNAAHQVIYKGGVYSRVENTCIVASFQ